MTCSLVVNSKSGNTRMVSGAIKRALQAAGVEFIHAAALSDDADADQVALEAQGACAADTVLVGFWCDKGACTPSVAALLSALHGKRVFLFGTCGFGADQSYFQQIIDRVSSNLAEDAELVGWAMCQGKMGPAVKQRYEAMLEQDPDNARFKMLLDNYGYTVFDLGRDVDPQEVLKTVKERDIKLVGLSALMTTTVVAMEETIKLLHAEVPGVKIIVGGAVLTPEYAKQIGADYYAKDAAESARIAEEVFGQ